MHFVTVPPAPQLNMSKRIVTSRAIQVFIASWEALSETACEFATTISEVNLISISHLAGDRAHGLVTVWHLSDTPDSERVVQSL
jgi:hypothetical protein